MSNLQNYTNRLKKVSDFDNPQPVVIKAHSITNNQIDAMVRGLRDEIRIANKILGTKDYVLLEINGTNYLIE